MTKEPFHVAIIGGGGTGAALAHDLTLRGVKVSLFERGELTSGTTGRHHGLLHSGARYAVTDAELAKECIEECRVLTHITHNVIERNYGLFIAQTDEECRYAQEFIPACEEAGIPLRELSAEEALKIEGGLSAAVRMAVIVPDGVIDAWRLPLQFFTTAQQGGAEIHRFTSVTEIQTHNNCVRGIKTYAHVTGKEKTIYCDMVVNAAGVWAGEVAALFGAGLPIVPGPGSMVAVKGRLVNTVVQRLFPPGDGDIVLSQRNLTIVGTTNTVGNDLHLCEAPPEEVQALRSQGNYLIPSFSSAPFHAAWVAVRPLVADAKGKGRCLSRRDLCVDHLVRDGIEGVVSIIGGKATTLRNMAEKTADLVCKKLGIEAECRTKTTPLLSHRDYQYGGL